MSARARDYRLDLFRGLALIFIFLDHIPANFLSWFTVRNIGFSDATEIFIFISGYTAALAYGLEIERRGFLFGAARIMHRCWQLYVAHIFLFVMFTAQIAYVASTFDNPLYVEEMGVVNFLAQPHQTLVQVLLLKFRPKNLDVLPLYIVLLLLFPAVLWLLRRWPRTVLGVSGVLYVTARLRGWNLPAYPEGDWFFNPFCWQLLFVLGAFFGRRHGAARPLIPANRWLDGLAGVYLLFAFLVVMTWHIPALGPYLPNQLGELLYPIDKTNLDVLRLCHFLALAYVTGRLVDPQSRIVRGRLVAPIRTCGRQSLQVFCTGTFLAFAGHFILVEVDSSLLAQIVVSLAGLLLMVTIAYGLSWYQEMEAGGRRTAPSPRTESALADQGGGR